MRPVFSELSPQFSLFIAMFWLSIRRFNRTRNKPLAVGWVVGFCWSTTQRTSSHRSTQKAKSAVLRKVESVVDILCTL